MPTEEQVRSWEVLELVANRDDEHNYLVNPIPLDQAHQEWLQSRVRDTTRSKGVFTNENSSETSGGTTLADESAPTEQLAWIRATPPGKSTIL
jgi:hypothetical protein